LAKAKEAFRNIGEVATELAVKKHVLRFWEQKFPQLRPMKRGGGRRLYRPSDVQLLRGIRDLLQTAGYKIEGVQKILREQGIEHVKRTAPARGPSTETASSASASAARQGSLLLSVAQVQALRSVLTQLEACQTQLAGAGRQKQAKQLQKRSSPPG
jgi:DNA-binding transcriptional MerR regulator